MEHILAALDANAAELPHLEVHRNLIRELLDLIRLLTNEQDLHRANKQQSSKRLQGALDEGRKVLTVVRVTLKQHYGSANEKLQEFGVQPFRGRSRELKVRPTPAPPAVLPPVSPDAPEVKPQVRSADKPSEPES
jgi:hypothetical protein